jgi:hypothetical protein
MHALRLIFVILGAIAAFAAHAQSSSPVFLLGQGDMTTMHNWELPRKQYEALPRWSPTDGAPPLAVNKALEIGGTWIKKRHPDVKQFDALSLSFVRAGCCVSGDERWFYRMDFQPVVSGQRMYGGQFIAIVLMNGTVVEPRLESRGQR